MPVQINYSKQEIKMEQKRAGYSGEYLNPSFNPRKL